MALMHDTKKKSSRQYRLVADLAFTAKDLGTDGLVSAAGAYEAIELPVGAVVTGGALIVDTISDATTLTGAIGDGGVTNRYLTATTLKTAARTPLVPTGYVYTATDTIDILVAGSGFTGVGAFRLEVEYYVSGKGMENQG